MIKSIALRVSVGLSIIWYCLSLTACCNLSTASCCLACGETLLGILIPAAVAKADTEELDFAICEESQEMCLAQTEVAY